MPCLPFYYAQHFPSLLLAMHFDQNSDIVEVAKKSIQQRAILSDHDYDDD